MLPIYIVNVIAVFFNGEDESYIPCKRNVVCVLVCRIPCSSIDLSLRQCVCMLVCSLLFTGQSLQFHGHISEVYTICQGVLHNKQHNSEGLAIVS